MNKVFLSGRLTKDPELKNTNNMEITRVTIAVDRRSKEKATDFFSLVAFGKTAEFLCKWFGKGSKLLVEGHLRYSTYEDKEGVKHYNTDVIADNVEFADSKKKAAGRGDFEGEYVPDEDTPF